MVSRIFLSSIDFSRSSTGDFSYDFNLSSKPPAFFFVLGGFQVVRWKCKKYWYNRCWAWNWLYVGNRFKHKLFLELHFHPIPKSQKGEMIHLTSGAARKVLHIGIVGVRFVRCVEVKTGKLSTIKQGNKTTRMVIQQFAGSLPSSSSSFQQTN